MKKEKNKKIIVAMSGGVDSSVAATLLKKSDFDVTGVFMKLWSEPLRSSPLINAASPADFSLYENRCCSSEAEARARKVAKILKIPFYVLNFEKEFKKKVVNYFLKEYKAGRTPNPCVVCNKEIKFGLLLEKVLALGADFVATGHYARKKKIENRKQKIEYRLLKGKDKEKDQSYFLWQLNQKQLKHILFPVEEYTKKEVRELAKKFGLPVLNVPESQEICFVQTSINDFLSKYIKPKPGPIVEPRRRTSSLRGRQVYYGVNKIVGKHQGLYFYTIGQRKGIKLAAGPWYVLDKDLKRNILIVTQNEKDLEKKELIAENVNWISGKTPELPQKVKVKIRYKSPLAQAKIIKKIRKETFKVVFLKKQRAITPGQSVVFYKGQELLGGGIIRK